MSYVSKRDPFTRAHLDRLTGRVRRVIELRLDGLDNAAIAERMGLRKRQVAIYTTEARVTCGLALAGNAGETRT